MDEQAYSISDYTACVSQYFRVNDRVIWLSKNGPKSGVVRWIGKNIRNDYTIRAVVEFDELVTKQSNICNIFETMEGHGLFLGLGELMKQSDYYDESGVDSLGKSTKSSENKSNGNSSAGGVSIARPRANRASEHLKIDNLLNLTEAKPVHHQPPQQPPPVTKKPSVVNDSLPENELFLLDLNENKILQNNVTSSIMNNYNRPPPQFPHAPQIQQQQQIRQQIQQQPNFAHNFMFNNPITPIVPNSTSSMFPSSYANSKKIENGNFWEEMVTLTRDSNDERKVGFHNAKCEIEKNQSQQGVFVGCKIVSYGEGFPIYGSVRWMGYLKGEFTIGIEFDEKIGNFSGWIMGQNLFKCKENYGILISLKELKTSTKYKIFDGTTQQIKSFPETTTSNNNNNQQPQTDLFGQQDIFNKIFQASTPTPDSNNNYPKSEMIPSNAISTDPFKHPQIDLLKFEACRSYRGIQGRNNSCYIDAVLIALFAFTEKFDSRLLDERAKIYFQKNPDTAITRNVRHILSSLIVTSLRSKTYFCPHDHVYQLRKNLIPINKKIESEFLDVEEFIYILFDKVYCLQEFINYNSGQSDFVHQIVPTPNKSSYNSIETIQRLFENSLKHLEIRLNNVPEPALILQMPRSSQGQLVSTRAIIPNLTLKISHLLAKAAPGNSIKMNLSSIICIKSSHFTTFTRTGNNIHSPWVHFDSNPSGSVPKVEVLTKMGDWIEKIESSDHKTTLQNLHLFPSMLQKILTEVYFCIYTSS